MFEDSVVLSHCPNCQQRIDFTVGQMRRDFNNRCPRCGVIIESSDVDRAFSELDEALRNLTVRVTVKVS